MSSPRPGRVNGDPSGVVSKRFDATQALDRRLSRPLPREVHSLVGENGAGKSTLIKIMTGIHPADSGEMLLGGEPFAPRNAAEAQRQGMAAIYQEPSVFPDLSVAENIFIGHQDRGWSSTWQRCTARPERSSPTLDIDIDPRLPAAGLTVAGSAGGRDRQGDLPRRSGADHGRAHGRALRPRGRPPFPPGAQAQGVRGRHPLHHPPPGGVVHDLRSDLGVPGWETHLHPARGRGDRGLTGQGDGGS